MGSRLEYLPGKWKAEVNSDENLVRTIHSPTAINGFFFKEYLWKKQNKSKQKINK